MKKDGRSQQKLATGLQAFRPVDLTCFGRGLHTSKTVAETPAFRSWFSSHRPKGRGFKPELVLR
jgi:hypothetical protein